MQLQINNLDFGYSDQLLFKQIQLTLGAGQTLCLKTSVLDGATSLLKCIAGIYQPINGEVLIGDTDIHLISNKQRLKHVTYCYEHGGLISTFTILNNVIFPLRYHGLMKKKSAIKKVIDIAEQLEIDHLLKCEPYQLNDVQTRLVNVLRALSIEPKVILIDEIQNGMSPELIEKLISVLKFHQKKLGFTLVMSTSAGDIINFADQVAQIKNKQIEVMR